jgi:hypothetical protein
MQASLASITPLMDMENLGYFGKKLTSFDVNVTREGVGYSNF